MGQNHIDQYIKDNLFDHKTVLDKEALWVGIESAQRRSRVLYLALAVGVVAIASIVLYGLSSIKTTSPVLPSQESHVGLELNDSNNNAPSENEFEAIGLPNKKEQTVRSESNYSKKSHLSSDAESDNIDEQKSLEFQSLNSNTKKQLETKAKFSNTKNKNLRNSELNQSDKAQTNTVEVVSETKSLEHTSQLHILPLSSLADIKELDLMINFDQTRVYKKMKPTECPTFGSKKKRIFAEIYTTLDYNLHSLSVNSIEHEDYLNARNATQSYQPSYTAGVQLKYLFENGLFLKAGLEYSEIREQFKHRQETITTEILPNQVISIEIDPVTGDSTIVLGNAPVTTIETKNWRVQNSYKSLGIPLFVGYQLDHGKWFYSIEGGIVYNLKFDFKGYLLDESLEPSMADNYFKDTSGINIGLGVTAGYKIKSNLSVLVKSNFRSITSNINAINNLVNHKINSIGAGVGMEYQF